jgi:hypothetical protein
MVQYRLRDGDTLGLVAFQIVDLDAHVPSRARLPGPKRRLRGRASAQGVTCLWRPVATEERSPARRPGFKLRGKRLPKERQAPFRSWSHCDLKLG